MKVRKRTAVILSFLLALTLIVPVPWLHSMDNNFASHWRLDGRLHIDGTPVVTSGQWMWVAVGRPPLLYEHLMSRFNQRKPPSTNLRAAPVHLRPLNSEPFAVGVARQMQGQTPSFIAALSVENPQQDGLPLSATIVQLDGSPVALSHPVFAGDATGFTFTTSQGETFGVEGSEMPYLNVRLVETVENVDAEVLFPALRFLPAKWFRNLALGNSHSLMVALAAYEHETKSDLTRNRVVAGTGALRSDGAVIPIGGLERKVGAAERGGAHIFFYPASQQHVLEHYESDIELVPVATVTEAVDYLTR